MGRKILLNGKIKDIDEVSISPASPALNYGCGFFETVLYEKGKLFFLSDHLERLICSCTALNTPILKPSSISEGLLFDLIEQNGMKDKSSRIKIVYAPLFTADEWVTALFCYPYERNTGFVKAVVCTDSRENQFNRHKTLSYMQNIILLQNNPDYDEVLFINAEGKIIEGAKSNIIGIKDNALYFVDNEENYLQGIMQKNIVKDHKKLGFDEAIPVSGGFKIEDLASYDEIIMSNSLVLARSISAVRNGEHDIKITAAGQSEKIRDFYITI
jgi:branched-subunit amino acid aminotransferase/4-amino-4-deoxychorismate lyase